MATSVEPRTAAWDYRPQLDGLRAIAVYLVVLFHSGSARFRGGFIGVDVFFVLSGFLVTNVVLTDTATGNVSVLRFYARRARRLIPAATATILGVSVAAFLMSNRLDRRYMIPDVRSASIWLANWHFIADANDYFESDGLESPLLHFWSLAVEEQFYLVFPLVLGATIWLTRGRVTRMIAVFAALVFVGVVVQRWWSGIDRNRAYMGTDARLYQPLAGAWLALIIWRFRMPKRRRPLGELLLGSSLVALVALAVLVPRLSASSRGILAVGAAGAAIVGSELNTTGVVAKTLSWRPIRYLGAISYGTYLWHWPIVAFSRRLLDIDSTALFVVSATLGTGLAALSYELLEQPIRKAAFVNLRPKATILSGVAMAVVVGFAICPILLSSARPAQVLPKERLANRTAVGETPVPDLAWSAIRADKQDAPPCGLADGSDCLVRAGRGPTVFLIGDSHARAWAPTALVLADKYDWNLYLSFIGGCPWPQGLLRTGMPDVRRRACTDGRQLTYEQVTALDPDLVLLAQRGFRSDEPEPSAMMTGLDRDLRGRELVTKTMRDSLSKLTDGRNVLLIEPVPEVAVDPLDCLAEAEFVEQCAFPAETDTIEGSVYRELADSMNRVFAINLDAAICGQLCPAIENKIVVRRDPSHLTATYARTLAPEFDAAMQKLKIEPGLPAGG